MSGSGETRRDATSSLMNYAVRMVVPLRREFGRTLDVHHFLHDFEYAAEVLEEAKRSESERVREYAQFLEAGLFGPRDRKAIDHAGKLSPNQSIDQNGEKPGVYEESDESVRASESEMRDRVLGKYKSGLR